MNCKSSADIGSKSQCRKMKFDDDFFLRVLLAITADDGTFLRVLLAITADDCSFLRVLLAITADDCTFLRVLLAITADEYFKLFRLPILRKATTAYGGNPVENRQKL